MERRHFSGQHTHEMDPKGRVILPSPFRKVDEELVGGMLWLSPNEEDECIEVYPDPVWQAYIEQIESADNMDVGEVRELIDLLYQDSEQSKVDGQNRLPLPTNTRDALGIDGGGKNVPLTFVGNGPYFKIYRDDVFQRKLDAFKRRKEMLRRKHNAGSNSSLNVRLSGSSKTAGSSGGDRSGE